MRKTKGIQIHPDCNDCKLHECARRVCLDGWNNSGRRKLAVFIDHPDFFADNSGKPFAFDTGKFLRWCFERMSVDPEDVAFEYTLRCYPKESLPTTKAGRSECIEECAQYRFPAIKRIRPRSIAVLGQVSLEAFTGKTKVGVYEGRRLACWEPVVRKYCDHVWVGYGVTYCLVSPSDSYRVFRVLYKAAEEAGLKPRIDPSVKPFQWRSFGKKK